MQISTQNLIAETFQAFKIENPQSKITIEEIHSAHYLEILEFEKSDQSEFEEIILIEAISIYLDRNTIS